MRTSLFPQAADYIAWMRLRRRHQTEPYRHVRESWSEINRVLCTDQIFDLEDYNWIVRRIMTINEGKFSSVLYESGSLLGSQSTQAHWNVYRRQHARVQRAVGLAARYASGGEYER
jgi:hypothetical protein